jgi:hypothetical protein
MGKENKATAEAVATSPEVKNEVVVVAEEIVQETILFKAEDGSEYEVLAKEFVFKGKKYVAQDAVTENAGVLEALVAAKSFILKKI